MGKPVNKTKANMTRLKIFFNFYHYKEKNKCANLKTFANFYMPKAQNTKYPSMFTIEKLVRTAARSKDNLLIVSEDALRRYDRVLLAGRQAGLPLGKHFGIRWIQS